MPVTLNDYDRFTIDRSWRMDKVAEDIKFGLTDNPNAFFSPYNMATVSRELGDLGYKNSEIIPLWFDKLDALMRRDEQTFEEVHAAAQVSYDQAVFGSMANFKPRHYVYQGFEANEQFQKEHLRTLLTYERDLERQKALDAMAQR